jgi:hypothetical protein
MSCAVPFTSILPLFPNAAPTKSSGGWKSPFKRFEVPPSSSTRAETSCAGVQAEGMERGGVSEGDQKIDILGRGGRGKEDKEEFGKVRGDFCSPLFIMVWIAPWGKMVILPSVRTVFMTRASFSSMA